jgi:putative flippase GtrA
VNMRMTSSSVCAWTAEVARIARFGVIGVGATLVYLGASSILCEIFGFPAVTASAIGQAISALVSYFGHATYSFRVDSNHSFYLVRFSIILALTFAMNVVITWVFTSELQISPQITFVVVTILIPIANYVGNRLWVFHLGIDRRLEQTQRHMT